MTKPAAADESGIVLVLTAISIMTIAILVGLVIDSGVLEYRKLTMKKAATSASLRTSQLYYDGVTDDARAESAAREIARLNLAYSGVSTADATAAAAGMTLVRNAASGTVTSILHTDERMYFSNVMKAQPLRDVGSDSAASYFRRESNGQFYRRIFIVFSKFATMLGPFQDTAAVEVPPPHATAGEDTKSAAGTGGVNGFLDSLDGQLVTLVGYSGETETFTEALPINDDPSEAEPSLSNRDYAKEQAQNYMNVNYGAQLSPALWEVHAKLQALDAAEREESLVLIISDGVVFNWNILGVGPCPMEPGRAMEAANEIRELGVTVSTIGLYATGVQLTGASPFLKLIQNLLDEMAIYGQPFMEGLASASNFGARCQLHGGSLVHPNHLRVGRYYAPRTERDLAVFMNEITSRKEFLERLPRRIAVP